MLAPSALKGEKHLTKQRKTALWLLCVAALLLLLYFTVLSPLLKRLGQSQPPKPPIALLEGEGYYTHGSNVYQDLGVIYPAIGYGDMFRVVVHNDKGEEYLFYHHLSDRSDSFYMGQYREGSYDEGGTPTFYQPEITDLFAGFDYTALYDGKGKIPAMVAAVGNVLFSERAYVMPSGTLPADLQTALHRYGLADTDNAPWIEVTPFIRDGNGNLMYTALTEGEPKLYGYNPIDKEYYDTEGITNTEDGYVYDPAYLYTGDKNALTPASDTVNAKRLYVGRDLPSGDGCYVRLEGRNVVYVVGAVKTQMADIDLANLVKRDLAHYVQPNLMIPPATLYDPFYTPHIGMFTGVEKQAGEPLAVGDTVYLERGEGQWARHVITNSPLDLVSLSLLCRKAGQTAFPLPTLPTAVAFTLDQTVEYTVTKIHGVCNTPYTEWTDGLAEQNALLRVTFKTNDGILRQGILPLFGDTLTDTQKDLFLGKPTGDCQITLNMTYTPTLKLKIEGVRRGLLPVTDAIEAGDRVAFSYYEKDSTKAFSAECVVNTESKDQLVSALSRYLSGKLPSLLTEEIGVAKDLCFTVEETVSVCAVLTYAEDLSFGFYYYGTGKRDPYLADSIYQITGPEPLRSYAVDSGAAQKVLEVFADFAGTDTVAVGLTPEVMRTYGLFAKRLDYDMTYNTKAKDDGQGNVSQITSDFRMGYTFYISQPKNGYRYVGSDAYDIVVRVKEEKLAFLDWDFLTRFSRSNLLLMYTTDIRQIQFITNYTDEKQHHGFWLSVDPAYRYESKGEVSETERLYVMYTEGEPQTKTPYIAPASAAAKPGVAVEYISPTDSRVTVLSGGTNLDEIYVSNGYTGRDRVDFMGVHYFRRMMTAVYNTRYIGSVSEDLTEAEITALLARPEALVTQMKVTLTDGRMFTYDFYAYSAERMMVSLTGYAPNGEVKSKSQLFYVNASEVKKMSVFCERLAAGQPLHEDESW